MGPPTLQLGMREWPMSGGNPHPQLVSETPFLNLQRRVAYHACAEKDYGGGHLSPITALRSNQVPAPTPASPPTPRTQLPLYSSSHKYPPRLALALLPGFLVCLRVSGCFLLQVSASGRFFGR